MKNTFIGISSLLASLFLGCVSMSSNEYIEGTSLTLGIYVPMNGQIYGIQAVNYLSGKRIRLQTNETFNVDSFHSVSNCSFGCFDLIDSSKTKIGR